MRLAAIVVACALTGCATQIDRIIVRDANLASAPDTGRGSSDGVPSNLPLEIHRIVAGERVVFSHKSYHPGSRLIIDDEEFEFLSWTLPAVDSPRFVNVESDDIHIIYTRGASAFPEHGCIGVAQSGWIDLEPTADGAVHVSLALRISAEPSEASEAECPELEVLDEGIYKPSTMSDLTPWLGSPFTHPYDASYP